MYQTYVYPLDGGVNVVTFTNLPAGQYDVLAYSVDGNYEVTVGGTSYGVKTTADPAFNGVPVWTEGVQYARFRNVAVGAGQPLVLTVRNGVSGYAILSGIQILSSKKPGCRRPLTNFSLLDVDFGRRSGRRSEFEDLDTRRLGRRRMIFGTSTTDPLHPGCGDIKRW